MRAFKTKPFARFAAKEGIADVVLRDAIGRAEAGLVDADLGGGVIKQRLARPGQGKSGGFRSIVLFRRQAHGVLRLRLREERSGQHRQAGIEGVRLLAAEMLALSDKELQLAIKNGTIMEIEEHG
jgi:hypothetical protein